MKTTPAYPIILGVLFTFTIFFTSTRGQTPDTISVILTAPDSLKACHVNQYHIEFALPDTTSISIRDSILSPCDPFNTCNTQRATSFEIDSGCTEQFSYNGTTSSWEITLIPGSYSINYNVIVDCSVIPSCIDSVSTSLKLLQIWTAPGIYFNISGSNEDSTQIFYPRLVELTDNYFTGNYLDTISVYHKYYNSGNTSASIKFSFEYDTIPDCNGISIDNVLYGYGVGANYLTANYYPLLSGQVNTAIIKEGDTLFVNKRVVVIDCLGEICNGERDTLVWKCNMTEPAFCDSCQNLLDLTYSLQNNSTHSISIVRLLPDSSDPIIDYSCMGDSVDWKYKITNTGAVNIPEAIITILKNNQIQILGYIDIHTIDITTYLSVNSSIDDSVLIRSQTMCTGAVDSALERLDLTIRDFMKGDSILLEFKTFRCCEENDSLYNRKLNFSPGNIDVTLKDSCGNTDSYTAFIQSFPEWDMDLEFFPPVSNLVVPKGDSIGPSTPLLFVDYNSPASYINENYQLFGCPDTNSSCPLNGYLRVNINCEPGLLIDTPFVSIINDPLDQPRVWNPVFYYSNDIGGCDTVDYFYYFDLADTNVIDLIHRGKLQFRLRSCCGGLGVTNYQIKFNLLFNPNNCVIIDFSDTTHLSPPICSDCCFIPLASTGDEIAIKCPGCTAPGHESLYYIIHRLNYGLQDSNNNGRADNPFLPIDSLYLATYGSSMRTQFANHGDIIEDLMVSHFPDGAGDTTGYMYTEMVADTGILHYMYLNRKFTAEDASFISINPFYIKLYIDIADSIAGNCIDCEEYLVDTNYRTTHIIEIDSTQISSYFAYNNPKNSILFNFSALDSVSNIFQNVIHHDSINSPEFTRFYTGQRYRMKTQYEICGMYSPTDLSVFQPDIQQIQKISIENRGFFNGQQVTINAWDSLPEMPGNMPDSVALNQQFADSFRFYCSGIDGRFWLLSDLAANFSEYKTNNNNDCQKYISISSINYTSGLKFLNAYPFEFRTPSFKPFSVSAFIPINYVADTIATIQSFHYNQTFSSIASLPVNFNISQQGNSVIINVDSLINLIGLECINDSTPIQPNDTLLVDDNLLEYRITINLNTIDCNPGLFYDPLLEDLKIYFDDSHYGCTDSINSICDNILLEPSRQIHHDTLRVPEPILVIFPTPDDITASTHQICWRLSINNSNEHAANVFILPPSTSYLSNWTIQSNGTTIVQDTNGFLQYSTYLQPIVINSDSLCAIYDSCAVADTLEVIYGWNCVGYPTSALDTSVCFIDTALFMFHDAIEAHDTPENHPDTFDLCDPFVISGQLVSDDIGSIYPYEVYLSNIVPGFTINSVSLTNCHSDTLLLPGTGPNWNLTDSIMSELNLSSFSLDSCLEVLVTLEAQCHSVYEPGETLMIPNINFEFYTFCGDTFDIQARLAGFSPVDFEVVYSGTSFCSDCFSIDKTALQNPAIAGDTVDFQIVLCGYNAEADTLNFSEYLPNNFTATSSIPDSVIIPANSCDTLIISGVYAFSGNCSDSSMFNTAVIYFGSDSLADTTCTHMYASCANQADIIIVPDSSFVSNYGTAFYSQTFYIDGRFYIDTSVDFYNCTILVNTGGQIIVLPFDTLRTDSTTIEGCDFMWQGIYLESRAMAEILEYSVVRDAEIGIFADNKTELHILNSSIEDCVRGVYVPPYVGGGLNSVTINIWGSRFGMFASTLKPGYPGQPSFGIKPFAGIMLNDGFYKIGEAIEDSNWFYNMNCGIIGFRSELIVENDMFEQIQKDTTIAVKGGWYGAAIASVGDSTLVAGILTVNPVSSGAWTIEDSKTGIYTEYSDLFASQINMTQMETGVFSIYCKHLLQSEVTYCNIEASRYGIYWTSNLGSSNMLAMGNMIYMDGANTVGITVKELSNAATSKYLIHENYIDMIDGYAAVNATSLREAFITNNVIHLAGTPQSKMTGIILEDGDSTFINCNSITGDDQTDILKTGVSVSISRQTQVGCNSTDSTGYGIFFGGICSETEFKGNSMNDHYTGLYLNSAAVIDQQPTGGSAPYHGNTWLDTLRYTSGYGAVSMNDDSLSALQLSLFTTNQSYAIHNPKVPLNNTVAPFYVNDQGWFDKLPAGSTFECLDAEFCGSTTLTGGGDELRMMIVQENDLTSEFIEESKFIAGQQLFAELDEDTSLLSQNSLFADFYSEKLTSSTGKLNSVKLDLGNIFSFSDSISNVLLSYDSAIKNYFDSILSLDSIHFAITVVSYDSLRESLLNQIYLLQQEKIVYLSAEVFSNSLTRLSALSLNESITAINIPDENEKLINEISLEGDYNAENLLSYFNQLLNVALQCPYLGGPAVYRARTLLSILTDSISYDDEVSCIAGGIYRNTNHVTKGQFDWIKISPNPANLKFKITLVGEFKGLCEVRMLDATGRPMLFNSFECDKKGEEIDVSSLASGIYQVVIQVNNKQLYNSKIAVTR